tara:strand:- start:86 stop:766 length:681 start_codon:yes stop_codon:yes gene_type:complete
MGGVPVTGYTPQIGFGGDPNAPQIDYTPEQIGNLLSQAPQSNPIAGALGLKNFLTSIQNKTPLSMGGPQTLPLPMSEPAGPPPGVPPVDPSSVGLGGNPMIFQPPMTDPTTINPALTDPPMLPKMADIGPVSVNLTPKVPSFMDESGGAIDFSIVDNPAATNINDILAGQGGFPKVGADVKGPVTAEESYNPAMEYYNPVFPMPQLPQQDPLINLAYNYNMENSPF